jgi:hypothetical protein
VPAPLLSLLQASSVVQQAVSQIRTVAAYSGEEQVMTQYEKCVRATLFLSVCCAVLHCHVVVSRCMLCRFAASISWQARSRRTQVTTV